MAHQHKSRGQRKEYHKRHPERGIKTAAIKLAKGIKSVFAK